MRKHTEAFLATLLWAADRPDEAERPLLGKTIHDFSEPFKAAADRFVYGYKRHLERTGRGDLVGKGERAFGGNVYFSLSGHGVGFFDDRDEAVAALHEDLNAWDAGVRCEDLLASAGMGRFKDLDCRLYVWEDGKLDLDIKREFIDSERAELFRLPAKEPNGTEWLITDDFTDVFSEEGEKLGGETAAGTQGPGAGVLTAEDIASHPDRIRFRLRDDDRITYYEGWLVGDDLFAPLDDFGEPNAGCTEIQLKEGDTWETV